MTVTNSAVMTEVPMSNEHSESPAVAAVEQPEESDRQLTDAELAAVSGGVGGVTNLRTLQVEPVDFVPKGSLAGLQVEPVDFMPKG